MIRFPNFLGWVTVTVLCVVTSQTGWSLDEPVSKSSTPTDATQLDQQPTDSNVDAIQDLIYCNPRRPLLIRLHIFVNGEGFRSLRRNWAQAQFAEYDTDKNGTIEGEEMERIPSRDVLHGGMSSDLSSLPPLDSVPADGKVTIEEFQRYLLSSVGSAFSIEQSNNFGNVQVDLFPMLDQNRDGKLSQAELESAADRLRRYDRNEDDVLDGQELLQTLPEDQQAAQQQMIGSLGQLLIADGTQSSTSIARRLLESYDKSARDPVAKTFRKDEKLSPAEINLTLEEFARGDRDGNGKLDRSELNRLSEAMVPTVELEIRTTAEIVGSNPVLNAVKRVGKLFTKDQSTSIATKTITIIRRAPPELAAFIAIEESDGGQYRLKLDDVHYGLGTSSAQEGIADLIRNNYLMQFKFLDGDKNDYLDANESNRFGNNSFFTRADIDRDGKVFEKEYIAQVDRELGLSKSAVSMTISTDGRSLFGLLDTDNDSRLSIREIRVAAEQFSKWDTNGDRSISLSELAIKLQAEFAAAVPKVNGPFNFGRQVQIAKSGMNLNSLAKLASPPPSWFTKMDRNRDGDLSPREFLGKRSLFDRFDTNHDGLISSAEANELPVADATDPSNVTGR